jgi:hypothetical protein
MKKVFLIGILGAVFLVFTYYYLLSPKRTSTPVLISVNNNSTWLKDLIKQEESNLVANPPASLSKCIYGDQSVYYLPPRCCNIPSILYSNGGNIICSPDGGFTGKGDEKCSDFFDTRKDCVVVWEDTRSN